MLALLQALRDDLAHAVASRLDDGAEVAPALDALVRWVELREAPPASLSTALAHAAAALPGVLAARAVEPGRGLALVASVADAVARAVSMAPLARSVPPAVLAEAPRIVPARAEVTVVFADARGFLAFTAEHTPAEVVATMNAYLARAVEVMFARRGSVGELVGDALVAVFGAPLTAADDSVRAVLAALDLRDAFAVLSAERSGAGLPCLSFGIGLARGPAVSGVLGGRERASYASMGPAMSMAASVQAQAAGGELVCTEAVLQEMGALAGVRADLLGYRVLKGSGQVPVYQLTRT